MREHCRNLPVGSGLFADPVWRGSEALREERQIGQHEDVPRIIAMKPINFFSHPPTVLQAYDYKCESVQGSRRYQTAEWMGSR